MCTGRPSLASEQFLDGRLEISGFAKETVYYRTSWDKGEEKYHDSRVDFANTSLYFESIYKVKESADLNITWFNGLRYWFEASPSYDDKVHRFMAHDDIQKYQSPRKFEDIVTESYLSFVKGPWDVRVGKQIVIWGQLDMQRVADVVNPLDLRLGVPGVDNWEEIKKGLWMIRTTYQSSLPGNLIFENIINPGYFQQQYLPYEGTHWGPPHNQSAFNPKYDTDGIYHWQQSKWTRDAPNGWATDNWELGFRVQGYSWDIDWTLLYWNAKSDNPIADANRAADYGNNYALPNVLGLILDKPANGKAWKGGDVFRFKRYQTFGGTAQTVIRPWHDSVWRLEWFYALDNPGNLGTDAKSTGVYDRAKNDLLGVAIQWNDKFDIPWWTRNIGTGKFTDISITYYVEYIRNMHEDLIVDAGYNHRRDDPYTQTVSCFLKQEMFNTTWVFVLNANYNLMCQKWFVVPCFTYSFPGEHWRADIGAKFYGGAKNEYVGDGYAHKDSLLFRLRYEF
jgi:hypothetical protein